jgi:hypothetical protein
MIMLRRLPDSVKKKKVNHSNSLFAWKYFIKFQLFTFLHFYMYSLLLGTNVLLALYCTCDTIHDSSLKHTLLTTFYLL